MGFGLRTSGLACKSLDSGLLSASTSWEFGCSVCAHRTSSRQRQTLNLNPLAWLLYTWTAVSEPFVLIMRKMKALSTVQFSYPCTALLIATHASYAQI